MIIKPGDFIRNYRVLDYIGEGGMGKVYSAEEELLGRKVAIKMLDPSVTHQEHFRQRFINEARILSQLQHPHIVGLFTFFLEQESYFMVMEYAEGQTLRDLIATVGPIPEQRTRRILRQILSALDYAQTKGVVHRDIKPSNIMIGENDDLKILDFGVARILANPQFTLAGSRLGTIYYMSPEQVRSPRDVDSCSDIYSTGVVLYEMLTGRLPFSTETESDFLIEKQIVESPMPHPRDYYPYMSDHIVDLMNAMTAKEPSLRPTAAEAIRALDTSSLDSIKTAPPLSEKPVPVEPVAPTPIPPAPKKGMPPGLRAFLVIFIIAIILVTLGFMLKAWLDINPNLFGPRSEEAVAEETVEGPASEKETLSQEEIEANIAARKRREAENAVRSIRPRFSAIARKAREYKAQDEYGDWPKSLDAFIDPAEADTDQFNFDWSDDGIIIAISNRAFGKAGIEIYYTLDSDHFEIYDPDPENPPNIDPAWLN